MAEIAIAAPRAAPGRFTYGAKIAAGGALVVLADQLFFFANEAGATLAIFAFALRARWWRRAIFPASPPAAAPATARL